MAAGESPRLLKADSVRGLGSKIIFNYDDLRERCDTHVEKVRLQAQQLITDAVAQADKIRAQAHAEGLAAGRREGLAQAEKDVTTRVETTSRQQTSDQIRTILPALKQAADALAIERDRWLAHWETAAIRLSVAIAEKIIHRKLETQPQIAADIVIDALKFAAGSAQIRLRLHPRDVALIGPHCEAVLASMAAGGEAKIVPDDSLQPGSCRIETHHGIIDAQLRTQLDRIAEELLFV